MSISDAERLEPFAEIGISLLLFSIGLELSFRRLWDMRPLVFGIGSAELLLSSLLFGGVILATGSRWQTATALGLALEFSSPALVLPMVATPHPDGWATFPPLPSSVVIRESHIFPLGVL